MKKLVPLFAVALAAAACGSEDPRMFPATESKHAAADDVRDKGAACVMSLVQLPAPSGAETPLEAWAFVHVEYLNQNCGPGAPTIVAKGCTVLPNWDNGFTALLSAPQPVTVLATATSGSGGGYAEAFVTLQ